MSAAHMVTARPIEDAEMIRRVITHPDIYPFVTDDYSPPPVEFDCVGAMANTYFIGLYHADALMGLLMFTNYNSVACEVHTCIFPEHRGAHTVEAARAGLAWMFANTRCQKVLSRVPEDNKRAYLFAKKVGLQDEGIDRASFAKGGRLLNQYVVGILKEELRCQQQP